MNLNLNTNTYDVILANIERLEGGGEAATPLVSLAPRETDAAVYHRCTTGVDVGSPAQEGEGSKGYIVSSTFW